MATDMDFLKPWLDSLDRLNYYELLGVPQRASLDAIRGAFSVFAASFHPDGYLLSSKEAHRAADVIFKRGTEAMRVLGEPALRALYDESLAGGSIQPSRIVSMAPASAARASMAPKALVDSVASAARPFVQKAETLLKKGDAKQAKLQASIALQKDPDNVALKDFLKAIEAQIPRK
jgi:curved DNA-binding protein CbpA